MPALEGDYLLQPYCTCRETKAPDMEGLIQGYTGPQGPPEGMARGQNLEYTTDARESDITE